MPSYSAISNTEIQVNKPITVSLMTRMRDNPLAIFEALGWDSTSDLYTSAEQTITAGGTVTAAHGLSGITNGYEVDVNLYLVCKSAEGGYSTGDVVQISTSGQGSSASTGISTKITSSNIVIRYGASGINITHGTTGGAFTITVGSWRLIIKARG